MGLGSLIKQGVKGTPKAGVYAGAAIAGVAAANPFQPISEGVQESLTGDPAGIRKAAYGAAVTGIADKHFRTSAQSRTIDNLYERNEYSTIGRNQLYVPNGDIVFGLYNNRLGG